MRSFPLLFMGLLFLFMPKVNGQDRDTLNLMSYTDYFDQQAKLYEAWLSASNLEQIIRFKSVKPSPTTVQLELSFIDSPIDSIARLWYSTCKIYEEQHGVNLKSELFHKMLRIFSLESTQASILISIPTSFYSFVEIYMEENQLKIDEIGNIKTKDSKNFIPLKFNPDSRVTNSINTTLTNEQVYKQLKSFFDQVYLEMEKCNQFSTLKKEVLVIDDESEITQLRITITGLCHQVFLEEYGLAFCEIINSFPGMDCQTVKREDFEYHFTYFEESAVLVMTINGTYHNDYYFFRGWSKEMDGEEFDDMLQDYANKLENQIVKWFGK